MACRKDNDSVVPSKRSRRNFPGWRFEDSDQVLCFEPDGSKAHVLYDAHILKRTIRTDNLKRVWPEYLVHFMRWSSSWDRVVPETFLLANCQENQVLQATIRKIISGKLKMNLSRRNALLETLLHKCLEFPPLYCAYEYYPFGPDSLTSRSISCDLDLLNSFISKNIPQLNDLSSSTPDVSVVEKNSVPKSKHLDGNFASRDSLKGEATPDTSSTVQDEICIELPLPLKQKLDLDWVFITRQHQVHSLPCTPTVSEIFHLFIEHSTSTELQLPFSSEEVVVLVKFFTDSIASLFNLLCADLLLYGGKEKQQHIDIIEKYQCSSVDIYGAFHLLRFFVRFPDMLSRLSSDDWNTDVVVTVSNTFLRFLSSRIEDIFPPL